MNKKLLCIFATTALLMGSGFVNAADKKDAELPPPPGHEFEHPRGEPKIDKEMHKKMADKFAKDLGLTEEQKDQAEKIREDGRKKVEPLMKEMKNLREKMDNLRKENMEEFEKILTPDQKTKLEQLKKDHDKMRGDRKHERRKMKKHNRDEHSKNERHFDDRGPRNHDRRHEIDDD